MNRRTLESRDIQPKARLHEKLRFNWNTPIALSPSEPGTIYIGAQFLFRSKDHGDTWERISPDLTTNDPAKQRQEESGGITVDNSAAETHTTIYSIAESPKDARVIWVGTDDGNIQLTRDGGTTWRNVAGNLTGVPKASWVSSLEASRFDPATAYVTIDRHTFGDMGTYVFRTTDSGATWTPLITPKTPGVRGYAHVVREDAVSSRLLFAGTEFGVWTSIDGGSTWVAFKPNRFPAVAVRDIAIQTRENDVVLGTHGRGIWIIDDISPLRALSAATLGADVAPLSGRSVQQRIEADGGWRDGDAAYAGDNPAAGAVISYYLRSRQVIGKLSIDILDASGSVVDTVSAGKRKGINRVEWSMRTKPPLVPRAAQVAGYATHGQRFLPGTYTVRINRAGTVYTMPYLIELDRRATYSIGDRKAQFDAANRVKALFARMSTLVARISALRAQAVESQEKLAAGDPLRRQLDDFSRKADGLRKLVVATREGGAITGEERLREYTDYVYGAILSTEGRPTTYALERVATLDRELAEVEGSFDKLTRDELSGINGKLKEKSLPELRATTAATGVAGENSGPAAVLFRDMIGTRYRGALESLAEHADR